MLYMRVRSLFEVRRVRNTTETTPSQALRSPDPRGRIKAHFLRLAAVAHEAHAIDRDARLGYVRRQDHLSRPQR